MESTSTRKDRVLLGIGFFAVFGMTSYLLGLEQPLQLIVQLVLWIAILVCAIIGFITEEKPDERISYTDSPANEPIKLHFKTERHYLAAPYADIVKADFITVGDRVFKSKHGEAELK